MIQKTTLNTHTIEKKNDMDRRNWMKLILSGTASLVASGQKPIFADQTKNDFGFGLSAVDDYVGKWKRGEMVAIYGPSGSGKTAFTMNAAMHNSSIYRHNVGFFNTKNNPISNHDDFIKRLELMKQFDLIIFDDFRENFEINRGIFNCEFYIGILKQFLIDMKNSAILTVRTLSSHKSFKSFGISFENLDDMGEFQFYNCLTYKSPLRLSDKAYYLFPFKENNIVTNSNKINFPQVRLELFKNNSIFNKLKFYYRFDNLNGKPIPIPVAIPNWNWLPFQPTIG